MQILAVFFCGSGILQDWKGFKTMVVHYIEWPTAASWSMMSMLVERLTLLMTGMMKFSGRYIVPWPCFYAFFALLLILLNLAHDNALGMLLLNLLMTNK